MLLPFEEFQGKGISYFSSFSSSSSSFSQPPSPLLSRRKTIVGGEEVEVPTAEPNSVLDALISPTSSSTVSSSHGGNSAVGGGGVATTDEHCGQVVLGDWEQVPHDQEQSILRLIMGDSTDPSLELNSILQTSPTFHDSDYASPGFGVVDTTGFALDHHSVPSLLINQSQTHYTQNPSAIYYGHPPAKRLNPGPMGITEQLVKAAEVIESGGGDTCLAQGILARLNQQLSSPVGKPLERAAFYFKEALNNLLHNVSQTLNPYSLIFKIAAYKSFSEISPVLQFANFTSNQALLESFQGFHRLHIVDFDIGYGGQWASLMQELVLRDNAAPLSLKITVFASPANHDQLELGFTQDNLKHFASEINISLDIQVLSLDLLGSISWPNESEEKEAVAVNISPASFSQLPLVLRFVKHLSPTIIVCSDRGCERTDLPFPQQLAQSLHSHAALLESLDAVNANLDAMQKIERFLIQPEIEKLVMDRSRPIERPMMTWQAMFLQMGFSPVTHSNFTESQAECLVQRTPVRGFHVEKKHNSLLLCWQRTELVGVSAWRCRSS
ncbi:PREDICTED: scarecrow-like protein 6 [Camelina sativa]|uniref:Scarecrow-like protein 6 n=2 Tax=Camelina sativa TaxID=90675 RepID=A0ABM0THT2_CAMSA|nr:PREDICTED: scarecrow-like protein 6 [Camelina sativa]XP_019088531.1 PREDICTED: scarecrow-like protein 6 [Camelina sativa]